jgi:ABC-2 type transport system ATP-binding protein
VESPSPPALRSTLPPVLEVSGLSKSYGGVALALNNVSFSIPAGQIVGLLGPNGAGKSTAMKTIIGILRPDAGTVRLLGQDFAFDPIAAKRLIGYVPENPQLYEFLSAAEYLDFVADMYGIDLESRAKRIPQFLAALELAGHENSVLSGYSQGMKQKVALIAALLHRPRFLLLDEPLNALDPRAARLVKDLLKSLAQRDGVGVLFSTHVLEIAEAICDRVVILSKGTVLASGTVPEIRQHAGLAGSGLEEVFLSLTGTSGLSDVAEALSR